MSKQPSNPLRHSISGFPDRAGASPFPSDIQIEIWRVLPKSIRQHRRRSVITAVLDRVHSASAAVDVECYGVLRMSTPSTRAHTHNAVKMRNCCVLPKPHVP